MILFGSAKKNSFSFGKWYLEYPDFWCKDSRYIRRHPYVTKPDKNWRGENPINYGFYQIKIDFMDFNKVFDLREPSWKDKLHTFITWYGTGWTSPGGMSSSTSPLEHVMFLGNYHVLASRGYRWVVFNHGPNKKGEYVELWSYVDMRDNPKKFYDITILDPKEL